jgi:RNA polymerase subunit RPABC4/transcription elongation factor Spt4
MKCPACSQSDVQVYPDGNWQCASCGASSFDDQDFCPQCGIILPPDVDICPECGQHLSYVNSVLSRPKDSLSASWLEEVRNRAGNLQTLESLASDKRMEALRAQDEVRLSTERKAQQEAREKERKILITAILFAFVSICVILVAAAVFFK